MTKKKAGLAILGAVLLMLAGVFGYRWYSNQTAVPAVFAGKQLSTYTPNNLFVDMTIRFANGHAYMLPTQTSTGFAGGSDPQNITKPTLSKTGQAVFKSLVGTTNIDDVRKVKVGQEVDLGRAQFSKSGKWWTVQTPKLTLKLTDRGATMFASQDGTFWLLRKAADKE